MSLSFAPRYASFLLLASIAACGGSDQSLGTDSGVNDSDGASTADAGAGADADADADEKTSPDGGARDSGLVDAGSDAKDASSKFLAKKALVGGDAHACALFNDGSVKCWGANTHGELGQGNVDRRGDSPGEMGPALPKVDLGSGRTAKVIAANTGHHTCAILDTGDVKCWGYNLEGQLGLGDKANRGDGPNEMGAALPTVNLGAGRTAVALGVRGFHSSAILDNGSLKCWGSNEAGQLGLGDTLDRGDQAGEMGDSLPAVDLGPGRTAVEVVAGTSHTCARLDDAKVKCWGASTLGEGGLGSTASRGRMPGQMGASLPAIDLGAGRSATSLTAGHNSTCALLDNATVKCWGRNYDGELGLGDGEPRGDAPGEMGSALPSVDLGPGRTALTVQAMSIHVCALLDDRSVKCWGHNSLGDLGLGDTAARGKQAGQMGAALPAVDLGPGRTARSFAGEAYSSCALLDDDSVKCWGNNFDGQLGLGDTAERGSAPGQMGASLPIVPLE